MTQIITLCITKISIKYRNFSDLNNTIQAILYENLDLKRASYEKYKTGVCLCFQECDRALILIINNIIAGSFTGKKVLFLPKLGIVKDYEMKEIGVAIQFLREIIY